jgi:hypothetical protein
MNFKGVDPRGYVVIFSSGVWTHAVSRHGSYIENSWNEVTLTLSQPDLILDNPPARAQPGRLVQLRTADERYVRWCSDLKQHIVIPVQTTTPEVQIVAENSSSTTKEARTIFTTDVAPRGTIVWRRV